MLREQLKSETTQRLESQVSSQVSCSIAVMVFVSDNKFTQDLRVKCVHYIKVDIAIAYQFSC